MHALGWPRQQAIDYCFNTTAMGMSDVLAEIDRYIAWPGQALCTSLPIMINFLLLFALMHFHSLAYKMGELKIHETRNALAAVFAANNQTLSVREFHDVILKAGAMPLDVMQRAAFDFFCSKYGKLLVKNASAVCPSSSSSS